MSDGSPWVARRVWPMPQVAVKGPCAGLDHLQSALLQQRHAGGIIAPVFQLVQALQQHRDGLPLAHISNNSAHI